MNPSGKFATAHVSKRGLAGNYPALRAGALEFVEVDERDDGTHPNLYWPLSRMSS